MSKDLKRKILTEVISRLERDLETLKVSAMAASEAATHEESKAEDKYDTRGLEASYLAGAQARRAAEMQENINILRSLQPREFEPDDPVATLALVEIETEGKAQRVFLVPKGGGFALDFDGQRIQVITPVSPLGLELVGRHVGDSFVLEAGGQRKEVVIEDLQ